MANAAAKKDETPNGLTIVQVNRESPFCIQLPGISSKSGVMPGKTIRLMPGMNFVDSADWAKAKENETVNKCLVEKIKPSKSPECNPERVGHCLLVEGTTVSRDNPLASLSPEDAVELVDDLFDVPLMKKFLSEESRPLISKALRTKIEEIENPVVRKTSAA